MTKSVKAAFGVGIVSLGVGIPASELEGLPDWALVTVVSVMLVVLSVREAVSQWIRVRASLVDPVGTHRVEAGAPTAPSTAGAAVLSMMETDRPNEVTQGAGSAAWGRDQPPRWPRGRGRKDGVERRRRGG